MARSKSSKQWLKEHFDDAYVKRSKEAGYRSRASFKLLEMLRNDKILRPGMTVVDLGAAPGGWSQVAATVVGDAGKVIASDILPMEPIAGVQFIQGNFTDTQVLEQILALTEEQGADLVISDMAPNMSGVRDIDQPRSIYLAELALDLARSVLKPGAYFIVKAFHGEGFDPFLAQLRKCFNSVKSRKPGASRARSRETYLVATGFGRE